MKKTIIAVSAIVLLLAVNVVVAKDNPNGAPFSAIWDAIENIQEQIDELVVGGGEQGPPGEDGEDGVDGLNCWDLDGDGEQDLDEDINEDGNFNALDCKGEGVEGVPGPQGPAGLSLKVVDSNSDEVGFLINAGSSSSDLEIVVFNTSVNKLVKYNYFTGQPLNTSVQMLYFESADCSGTALTPNVNNPYTAIKHQGSGLMYSANDFSDIFQVPITTHSNLDDDLLCHTEDTGFSSYAKIYPITMPSYTGPLSFVIE